MSDTPAELKFEAIECCRCKDHGIAETLHVICGPCLSYVERHPVVMTEDDVNRLVCATIEKQDREKRVLAILQKLYSCMDNYVGSCNCRTSDMCAVCLESLQIMSEAREMLNEPA